MLETLRRIGESRLWYALRFGLVVFCAAVLLLDAEKEWRASLKQFVDTRFRPAIEAIDTDALARVVVGGVVNLARDLQRSKHNFPLNLLFSNNPFSYLAMPFTLLGLIGTFLFVFLLYVCVFAVAYGWPVLPSFIVFMLFFLPMLSKSGRRVLERFPALIVLVFAVAVSCTGLFTWLFRELFIGVAVLFDGVVAICAYLSGVIIAGHFMWLSREFLRFPRRVPKN